MLSRRGKHNRLNDFKVGFSKALNVIIDPARERIHKLANCFTFASEVNTRRINELCVEAVILDIY